MEIDAIAEKAQSILDREAANNPAIRKMIGIVESFIKEHRVMCYGGTAINNLLPTEDQFYDPETDIPDYDFYSETPQLHAMMLADKFERAGYTNIETKPGTHLGTFKVFVDFNGIADITELNKDIFERLWKEDIQEDGIHYVTPNFLRMSMYLELSRPRGDVSRWSKVYRRLQLLNKHYPVGCPVSKKDVIREAYLSDEFRAEIETVLGKEDVILLGMNAALLHLKEPKNRWTLPLDILALPKDYESVTEQFAKLLDKQGKIHINDYPPYEELLPRHADIVDKESGTLLVRVFETSACHSYHQLKDGMKIASIPTLLQFFFAFLYADQHFMEEYDENRIICTAERLMNLANGSSSKRRFQMLTPLECLGKQETLFDMREHASKLRQKLSKDSPEFLRYFFTYKPTEATKTQKKKLRKELRKTMKHH